MVYSSIIQTTESYYGFSIMEDETFQKASISLIN